MQPRESTQAVGPFPGMMCPIWSVAFIVSKDFQCAASKHMDSKNYGLSVPELSAHSS